MHSRKLAPPFLEGNANANYRRVLKFKILKKRKELTGDLVRINEVLDQLQEI
jgi:hypothetical protein